MHVANVLVKGRACEKDDEAHAYFFPLFFLGFILKEKMRPL